MPCPFLKRMPLPRGGYVEQCLQNLDPNEECLRTICNGDYTKCMRSRTIRSEEHYREKHPIKKSNPLGWIIPAALLLFAGHLIINHLLPNL